MNAKLSFLHSKLTKNLLVALEVKISFTVKIISPELQSDIKTVMLFFLIHKTCICTLKNKNPNAFHYCFKGKIH